MSALITSTHHKRSQPGKVSAARAEPPGATGGEFNHSGRYLALQIFSPKLPAPSTPLQHEATGATPLPHEATTNAPTLTKPHGQDRQGTAASQAICFTPHSPGTTVHPLAPVKMGRNRPSDVLNDMPARKDTSRHYSTLWGSLGRFPAPTTKPVRPCRTMADASAWQAVQI